MTPTRLEVGSGEAASTVWLGAGTLESAGSLLVSPSGRYLVFSAPSAGEAAGAVRRALDGRILLDASVDDREAEKTLAGVERLVDAALAAGVRRDDAIVAVGGGVVSDLVGFAAAILLRGVAWNAVPTTTGAMADAAVGGKTGVDHSRGKNLIGAFHAPRAILVDPRALGGLPERDYRAGLVEAFKAAWIDDAALADRAERELPALLSRDEGALLELLTGSVRVKASLVTEDPQEKRGRRRLLNFGHTLGHAFEAAGSYRDLKHGEAVAWGIAAALEVSCDRAGLPLAEAERIRLVLARLGPFPEPVRDPRRLSGYVSLDKKGTSAGLAAVLLEAVGRAKVEVVPPQVWLEAAERARI